MKSNATIASLAFTLALPAFAQDPLPSWNDTAPKKAVVAFVEKVTKESSLDFVPPAGRIATFDNDGTLWAEQPLYFQFLFAIERVKALAPQHPEWKEKEPFASLLKGDLKSALTGGEPAILQIVMATHAGMTTEEFEKTVRDWITTAKHPKTGRLYSEMVYQPMLELLAYLRANGFKTFIVSGGGVEFMRVFSEQVYGIPPEQVIGSSGKLKFEMRDGKPVLVKLPEIDFIDDKAGKPVGIQKHIGRRPLLAFGNSDGDLQMLQWTGAGDGPRFTGIVHHTDAQREWAYDRQSSIGRLDKGLDEAQAKGWTVVSMKDDWKTVFPTETSKSPAKAAIRHPGSTTSRKGGVGPQSSGGAPADGAAVRSPGSGNTGQQATTRRVNGSQIQLGPLQVPVLERVNYHRTLAGVAPVAAEPRLLRAAQSHTSYLDSANQMGHYEDKKTNPYYTGNSPFDRIDVAHYDYAEAGEVVARQSSVHPADAVDALVMAIYHRFIILSNDFVHAGPGVTLKAHQGAEELNVTVDFGAEVLPPASSPTVLTVYPADGQTGVPVDFNPTEEEPNPLPGPTLVGYPVSIQVDARHAFALTAFELYELTPSSSRRALDVKLLTHDVDAETPAHAAALIPLAPLVPSTTYQLAFSGSVNGVPVSKTWQFTTASQNAVTISFASPSVAPGGIQKVTLDGLDIERGPYYLCYTPSRLVKSLMHETETQIAIKTGTECDPGNSCQVTISAAYGSCAKPFARGTFTIVQQE